jgi:hypothetical protein
MNKLTIGILIIVVLFILIALAFNKSDETINNIIVEINNNIDVALDNLINIK